MANEQSARFLLGSTTKQDARWMPIVRRELEEGMQVAKTVPLLSEATGRVNGTSVELSRLSAFFVMFGPHVILGTSASSTLTVNEHCLVLRSAEMTNTNSKIQ